MNQKKKIFYKIFRVIIISIIIYNFIYLANTTITRKKYLDIFGISFLPLKNLVITRERRYRQIARK